MDIGLLFQTILQVKMIFNLFHFYNMGSTFFINLCVLFSINFSSHFSMMDPTFRHSSSIYSDKKHTNYFKMNKKFMRAA